MVAERWAARVRRGETRFDLAPAVGPRVVRGSRQSGQHPDPDVHPIP